jgi:hypothetical protein
LPFNSVFSTGSQILAFLDDTGDKLNIKLSTLVKQNSATHFRWEYLFRINFVEMKIGEITPINIFEIKKTIEGVYYDYKS